MGEKLVYATVLFGIIVMKADEKGSAAIAIGATACILVMFIVVVINEIALQKVILDFNVFERYINTFLSLYLFIFLLV